MQHINTEIKHYFLNVNKNLKEQTICVQSFLSFDKLGIPYSRSTKHPNNDQQKVGNMFSNDPYSNGSLYK